ncbi:putative porin [Aquirhabdus sp.]|uniref:putative porin n=1 Tax=Aquirhabdus sp. TaxID=2824160 RepID=UPI00396C85CC
MKKILLTAAIASLSLNAAHAYQVELNGGAGYNHINSDSGAFADGKTETGSIGGSATYYFNQVHTQNGPLAEAAFIERASNVFGAYSYSKDTVKIDTPYVQDDFDVKAHHFSIGGEFYVPDTNFYASANVNRSKTEGYASKLGTYGAEVGYLPITNLLVAVGVAGTYGGDSNNDETDATVRAKYLTKLGNNDVNLEGKVQFGDRFNAYAVSGDYYLDRTLSIGASYNLLTQDHFDDTYNVGINARKFVAENISVQGGVYAGKDLGDNDYGFSVGGTYRF